VIKCDKWRCISH